MRLLSPSFKSPRGVADVFEATDRAGVKEKLSSSFSWVDNDSASSSDSKSINKSPSKKTTTTKSVRITSEKGVGEPKEKMKKIKKIKIKVIPTSAVAAVTDNNDVIIEKHKKSKKYRSRTAVDSKEHESTIRLLKEAIEQTRKRLEEVNEQRKQDSKDTKEHLRKAKQECKEQLEEIYKPIIDSHLKDGKTNKQKQAETANVIEYLKNDNAKIRKEIESYARKIKELKANNASLERCNFKAEEGYAELTEHVETMTAVNQKLNENVTIFKDTLKAMKRDYAKRLSHHQCEVNSTEYYDACIGKIVKTIKDRSRDPDLVEEVYNMAAEGSAEVDAVRQEHSPNVDLGALPKDGSKNKTKGSWSFMCEEEPIGFESDSDDDDDE